MAELRILKPSRDDWKPEFERNERRYAGEVS
jgi:hypothetical protein